MSTSRHKSSVQPQPGFDFSQNMNLDWSGPQVGEHLELQRFAGRNGERLTDAVDSDFFMLVTVDPDCAACLAARDEMYDVRNQITRAKIPYLLVSVTASRPSDEFFKYVESFGLNAPAFLWTSKDSSPPASLFTMVIPSHILVKRDGTILRVYPGTSQNKRVRFQMMNQFVADAIETATNQS